MLIAGSGLNETSGTSGANGTNERDWPEPGPGWRSDGAERTYGRAKTLFPAKRKRSKTMLRGARTQRVGHEGYLELIDVCLLAGLNGSPFTEYDRTRRKFW